jgi:mannose-6-phosphate isomerase-like protein (cupin superfamily)
MAKKPQLRVMKAEKFDAKKSLAKKSGWPKQKLHISHLREEDFKTGDLRAYALARDLGFAKATGGLVEAHVNRRARPFNYEEVAKRHFHDIQFQMVYVLRGTARMEFEGYGEVEMRPGTAWIQPPGIKHTVLHFSEDYEILEMIIPAVYDTYNLDEPPGGHKSSKRKKAGARK